MKKWIICSGPDWYRPSVTSTKHIINFFHAAGFNILWVNPIPFKSPTVNSVSRNSVKRKIFDKLKTHAKLFSKHKSNFFIYVPFYLPFLSREFLYNINQVLISFQLKLVRILLRINLRSTILVISGNFTLLNQTSKPYKCKIYQAADLISAFRTEDKVLKEKLYLLERALCDNVDFILTSSPNIKNGVQKLFGNANKIIDFPHGVHFDKFNTVVQPASIILKIKSKNLPIVGYFGSLSDANDKEVLKRFALEGYSVVLIGKVIGDYRQLEQMDNIHFLGPVAHKQLPSFAQSFDICLMNWLPGEWIKNSFPIKSLEYLSMGKPIISIHIPIIKDLFGDLIYYADSPELFLQCAKEALAEESEVKSRRIDCARNYDWSIRFKSLKKIIDEC